MKKFLNLFLSIILSLITVIIFKKFLNLNIIYLIIYFLLFFFINYKYLFKLFCKRTEIFSICFSLIFSFFQVLGYNCLKYYETNIDKLSTFIYIIVLSICFYSFFKFLFSVKINFKFNKFNRLFEILFNKKYSFFIILFLIVLAWLPTIISFYPGNYAYDVETQMKMFMHEWPFNMYQPVIHTAFLGSMIKIGEFIFDSSSIGVFLYSIIQILVMGSIFSYIIMFLHKKLSNFLCLLFLIIFMFLPTHCIMSITTTKDVIFSGVFALLFINFIKMIDNPNLFFKYKKNIILLILWLFITFIFRNNMIYAFILFFPFVCICFKKYFKKLFIIFCASILIYFSYNFCLIKGLRIGNILKSELLSVPMQQLVRTYNYGEMDDADRSSVEMLFTKDIFDDYSPVIADSVKLYFNYMNFTQLKKDYLKLYIRAGINNKKIYFDSWFNMIYSYFYVYDELPNMHYKTYIEVNTIGDKYMKSNNYKKTYFKSLFNEAKYQDIPILNIFMNLSLYVWVMIFVIVNIIRSKKYKLLIPISLLTIYFLTLLLGPVSLLRYVYPLFVCFPLMVYLFIKTNE